MKESIESAAAPLVYQLADAEMAVPDRGEGIATFRTATRALAGMQKEALVAQFGSPVCWRMVCDEGPYLNGTDLAPAPLAFFSAGMAASFADAILDCAREMGANVSDLRLDQENRYRMDGSALKGTMVGSALPVQLGVSGTVDNGSIALDEIAGRAIPGASIEALMREELVDTFSLVHNGKRVPTGTVAESDSPLPEDPAGLFGRIAYDADVQPLADILQKLEGAEIVADPTHGAGASMKETQKRELLVRSALTVRPDGLREIRARIARPIGSQFRFLADDSRSPATMRAPTGLAYLSAGLAFCFMTQLGRYAGILKKDLSGYGIVQDTAFDEAGPRTFPVDTHTFLEMDEDDAVAQKYIDMGEQTCFLHAACRSSNATVLRVGMQ
jgi:uncharacterized OsmC-like protein